LIIDYLSGLVVVLLIVMQILYTVQCHIRVLYLFSELINPYIFISL